MESDSVSASSPLNDAYPLTDVSPIAATCPITAASPLTPASPLTAASPLTEIVSTHVVMTAMKDSQNLTLTLEKPSDLEILNYIRSSPSLTPTFEEGMQCDIVSKELEIRNLKAVAFANIMEKQSNEFEIRYLKAALLTSTTEKQDLEKNIKFMRSEYLILSNMFESRKRALVISQKQRQELANSQSPTPQSYSRQSPARGGHLSPHKFPIQKNSRESVLSKSTGSSPNTSHIQTIPRQSSGGDMYSSLSPASLISSGKTQKTQPMSIQTQPMSRQSVSSISRESLLTEESTWPLSYMSSNISEDDKAFLYLQEEADINRSDFDSFPEYSSPHVYSSFNFAAQSAGGGGYSSTYPSVTSVDERKFQSPEKSKSQRRSSD
jgi:hypothetical protein